MKARRAPNEKHGEWIARLRTLAEVAELEHITVNELGIHVFIESADQKMSKLAIDELEKKTPSLKRLTNAEKGTKASQWYNPNSQKGFSKAAAATNKQCGKCDAKGHTYEECWGRCTFCAKYNHRSERCFFKDAQKEEKVEKANKAQHPKQKMKNKRKAKKANKRLDKQEEVEESESEYSEEE